MRYALLALLLSGCSTMATDRAARIADKALEAAEYAWCKPNTVGAWNRRYGSDEKKAAAFRVICFPATPELPSN